MSEKDYKKLKTIVKIWNDYETSSNVEYGHKVLDNLNVLLELTNTLHKDNVKLPEWKIWAEPLIFKFCYHASSVINLFNGTELPFKVEDKNIVIFDEPSMFVLFRTTLENYLTFFYLFADQIDDKQKVFRNLIWRYCGLKQRVSFQIDFQEGKKKQQEELAMVERLKKEIEASEFFWNLTLSKGKKF